MKHLVLLLSIPLATTWRGFAVAKIWLWFCVPQFGLAPMRIPFAIGISGLISLITYQVSAKDDGVRTNEQCLTVLMVAFLLPAMALLGGWIVKFFI